MNQGRMAPFDMTGNRFGATEVKIVVGSFYGYSQS